MKIMLSCILLCAGESRRFGSPKALVTIGRQKAIARIQYTLVASCVDEIIVVLGAHSEKITAHILNHKKIRIAYNKDYTLGQTSSFQKGILSASSDTLGFMLYPVDYPWVQQTTVDTLSQMFLKDLPDVLIPSVTGQKGHPPIFHARLKDKILSLPTNKGVNSLLKEISPSIVEVFDHGVIKTFNTFAEWKHCLLEG